MTRKIPLIAHDLKRLYTGFLLAAVLLFAVCTYLTQFNPMVLAANGGRLLGIHHGGFSASRPAQGQPHPRHFLQRAGDPGPGHVRHHRGCHPGIFRGPVRQREGLAFPALCQSGPGLRHLPAQYPRPGMGLYSLLLSGHRHRRGLRGPVHHQLRFMVRAFVETMEDVSQDCVESLQAVGATFPQRVAQAILPSCLSGFLSWFLYCVEVNIRASTIVGMVGGGGVGLTLFSYIKSFRYDIALTIILLIAAMVIVVDQITGKLRKELLK